MLKITEEQFKNAVKDSFSIATVIKKLGYTYKSGGSYHAFYRLLSKFPIDISHFKGRGWSKNRNILNGHVSHCKYSKEEIFCENSKVSRCRVRELIIENNLIPYKCHRCSIDRWQNEKLPLDLEHINGKKRDHRIENLCFLCPNCHSLTATYRGRNNKGIKRKPPIPDEEIINKIKESHSIRETLIKLGLSEVGGNYNRIKKLIKKHNLMFLSREQKKTLASQKALPNPNWRTKPKYNLRKVERPTKEELAIMLQTIPILKIANKFGVTDNAIRKWCILYELDFKKISPYCISSV